MNKRGINIENENKLRASMLKSGKDITNTHKSPNMKQAKMLHKVEKKVILSSFKIKNRGIKTKGRPARFDRPDRSAAKRTLVGEERYIITIPVELIKDMKAIAELKKITIKEVYRQAIEAYLQKIKQ